MIPLIIRDKALDFAKELNITDFKASEGWLDWWKNRHNVVFRTVSGEERSCTEEMSRPICPGSTQGIN